MKKILIALCLSLALFAAPVQSFADTAVLEITMRDRINLQDDVEYYRVYYSQSDLVSLTDVTGVSYIDLQMTDLRSGVTDPMTQDYIDTFTIDSPGGAETTWFFAAKTFDIMGRESDWSNQVEAIVDFRKPGAPEIIDLILKVGGKKVRIIIK